MPVAWIVTNRCTIPLVHEKLTDGYKANRFSARRENYHYQSLMSMNRNEERELASTGPPVPAISLMPPRARTGWPLARSFSSEQQAELEA